MQILFAHNAVSLALFKTRMDVSTRLNQQADARHARHAGAPHSHSEYGARPDSVVAEVAMLKSLHTDQNAEFLSMLRTLRRKRRLRQEDLARLLRKSQATVSKVEQGTRRLDLMELRQWLAVLECDFLDFMNELSARLAAPHVANAGLGTLCRDDEDSRCGRSGGCAGDCEGRKSRVPP